MIEGALVQTERQKKKTLRVLFKSLNLSMSNSKTVAIHLLDIDLNALIRKMRKSPTFKDTHFLCE